LLRKNAGSVRHWRMIRMSEQVVLWERELSGHGMPCPYCPVVKRYQVCYR
jgi:hypothetical protein